MEHQEILVRRANEADIDTIVKFNMEMARETENLDLARRKLSNGVASVFEDSAKGFYLVAECDSRIVGQALITYEWSDWRDGVFWWIQSVYVLPDYRRKSVFRSIFEHIRRIAESNSTKVCGFRLYVHMDNYLAKRAYESLGIKGSHYEMYEMLIDKG